MQRHLTIALLLLTNALAHGQVSYVVEPLKVSPLADDYAPVLVDSTLVFCSLRDRDNIVGYRNELTDKPFSDLYRIELFNSGSQQPRLLGDALAGPLNDGPASFLDHGSIICFTKNQAVASKLGNTKSTGDHLGLYFANKVGTEWTIPEPFEHNSTAYSVMHAAFTSDGGTLYFASDMPGGEGGMDLYACKRKGEGWTLPENLGSRINTEANEVFPFSSPNGMLYFSSDREGGMGALDIHSSSFDGKKWSAPVALPAPVNSSANDLGYTSYLTDRSGFFSSDRDGSDRIYGFRKVIPLFTDCPVQQVNNYCFEFKAPVDASLDKLPLIARWDMGDGTFVNGAEAAHCYAGPGVYQVRLDLIDSASNSVFFTKAAYELPIEDIRQAYITSVDSIRSGRRVIMNGLHSNLPGFAAEEYHWNLGDGTVAQGASIAHAWKEPGTYTIKLDLLGIERDGAHLTQHCVSRTIVVIQRFEDVEDSPVVAQYQDAAGVTREFEYQSLPFDQFDMAIREGEDATFSIELFARKERMSLDDPAFVEIRKTYRVVERYDPDRGVYTYSVGDAKELADLYDVYRRVKELQFLDAEVMVIHSEKVTDLSALQLLSTKELDNTVVRASTVYFENDQYVFNKNFEPQLKKLLSVLDEHPQVSIVIEAHTDAIGKDDYNLKLSQKRAQNIVDYLLADGVTSDRLVPVGHGENHPIADNTSEDGRGQNRRVEFRLQVQNDQAYERKR
ncbi:MAG: OmpA family protein [Flavobacteriales bacterium]|nr:OmpA family protein [Flavobacteriales bacterium]